MFKYLLMASVLCMACEVYAGGDAKNMPNHELRVKAAWNCKSAQGWCAEDQSVAYNKCKCAKRMCDAAQRAKEAAERGFDDGAACADGGSYCAVAKSAECTTALAGPRPAGGGGGGGDSKLAAGESCPKEEGQTCVKGPGGQCNCFGNAKGLSCSQVKQRMVQLKARCDKAKASAEGDVKGICKDYEDRRKEAEQCDKDRENERNTGNAKGDDCSTVIKKAQILKGRCEAAKNSKEGDNKGVCKAYEDRRKEAERCGAKNI